MANSMSNSIPSSSSSPLPISSTTIDDLPESLLIHILSFLYITDAIQTSLISRKFLNLWHSIPSLNFDGGEYYSRFRPRARRRSHESRQVFAEFVNHTISHRKPYPLTKFALVFEYTLFDDEPYPLYQHWVKNWIKYAIGLNVTELMLEFNDQGFDMWGLVEDDGDRIWRYVDVELCLLDISQSRVEVLKLFHCSLKAPAKSNPIKIVCLKSVEICAAFLNEEDVGDWVKRCVNLETLKFIDVGFGPDGVLNIYSASLKELSIESWRSSRGLSPHLTICCPSLRKISFIDFNFKKNTIKDAAMLAEARLFSYGSRTGKKSWEKMLSCFTNVSSLPVWDELLETDGLPAGCEQFSSNVKHLKVYCAYDENNLVGLAALLKLFPNLEVLVLHIVGTLMMESLFISKGAENVKLHKDYWGASTFFNMPRLRKVILREYHDTIGERHFIKLFRKNGVVLEEIKLLHS